MEKTQGSMRDVHAAMHTTQVDVFANGSPSGITEDMPPKPGLLVVEYLPTRLADPVLMGRLEDVQNTFKEHGENVSTIAQYTETLADVLLSILWDWNRTDPISRDVLIKECGPMLLSEILTALMGERGEKKGSEPITTSGSLTTQPNVTAKRARRSNG